MICGSQIAQLGFVVDRQVLPAQGTVVPTVVDSADKDWLPATLPLITHGISAYNATPPSNVRRPTRWRRAGDRYRWSWSTTPRAVRSSKPGTGWPPRTASSA